LWSIEMTTSIKELAQKLGEQLAAKDWRIATAESCTGGGVAAAITAIAGSSAWFEYGVVSYANVAKQKLLGVSAQTLDIEGAVSEAVVVEMARGALALSGADLAVAISGIAGPSGATPGKPVGTVWFAWATAAGDLKTDMQLIDGDRAAVQHGEVIYALEGALAMSKKNTV
jgi:nicotinamide-nucleotide amidase